MAYFHSNYGPLKSIDTSGIKQAGQAYGNMFQQLGKTAASAIEKFREGKEKKEKEEAFQAQLQRQYNANPDLPIWRQFGIETGDEAGAVFKDLSKKPEMMKQVMDLQTFMANQRDSEDLAKLRKLQREKLQSEVDTERDINQFMFPPPPPDSIPTGQLGPDGKEIPTLPGSFAQRVVPEKGFRPTGPTINVASGEVTSQPSPATLPLPEQFKAVVESGLSPEAKAKATSKIKAEYAAKQSPELDLQNKMRFEEFKSELDKPTGPKDTSGSDVTNDAINRALPRIGAFTTGFGAYLKSIPGTEAKELSNLLVTIKANIGFDKLQAMRNASPTGGALGNVSEKELTALQSVFGNLDQSNDSEELKYNLNLLRHVYNNVVHGKGSHSFPHPDGTATPANVTDEDIQKLRREMERKRELEAARINQRVF
jgi:hypothetical protein